MPVYAFSCETCGPFDLWRPVADAGSVVRARRAGLPHGRRFTPPGVARTPAPLRSARDREDRSGHEPEVVRAPAGRPLPWKHAHAHGHH